MTFAGHHRLSDRHRVRRAHQRASLRKIGVFSNPLLLWGIGFELVFAAAIVYLPPFQELFATACSAPASWRCWPSFPSSSGARTNYAAG